jgi:hypothetical protein
LHIVKFVRVSPEGLFTVVDMTRVLIKSTGSFGTLPRGSVQQVTKEDFDNAVQQVLKKLIL